MRRLAFLGLFVTALLTAGCAASYQSTLDELQKTYVQSENVTGEDRRLIMNETVKIGWPREHVEAAIGPPDAVNATTTQGTRRLQLVYKSLQSRYREAYVYLENGRVTAVQNAESIGRLSVVQ
jgi:hypothetical protein